MPAAVHTAPASLSALLEQLLAHHVLLVSGPGEAAAATPGDAVLTEAALELAAGAQALMLRHRRLLVTRARAPADPADAILLGRAALAAERAALDADRRALSEEIHRRGACVVLCCIYFVLCYRGLCRLTAPWTDAALLAMQYRGSSDVAGRPAGLAPAAGANRGGGMAGFTMEELARLTGVPP
jgi:hypothetical protein